VSDGREVRELVFLTCAPATYLYYRDIENQFPSDDLNTRMTSG
jgi:hypothetical protein